MKKSVALFFIDPPLSFAFLRSVNFYERKYKLDISFYRRGIRGRLGCRAKIFPWVYEVGAVGFNGGCLIC